MTDTNQLPEPELGYIQTDKSNQPAFSARQMREAVQARAQVQGEPSWWMRETDEGAEWTDTAPLVLSGWTPLYATPQPSHATQPAEVTDADIVAVMRDGNNCNYNDEAEHIQFARAILALCPERVPMTDEQIRSLCKQGWVFETVKQWVRIIEAHHGITAQAKKETP